MAACLSAIRSQALDKTNGPYGVAFFERCPLGNRDNINCFETEPIFELKSLSELTFQVADQDLSTIDRFLAMRYKSRAGNLAGCISTAYFNICISFVPLAEAPLRDFSKYLANISNI